MSAPNRRAVGYRPGFSATGPRLPPRARGLNACPWPPAHGPKSVVHRNALHCFPMRCFALWCVFDLHCFVQGLTLYCKGFSFTVPLRRSLTSQLFLSYINCQMCSTYSARGCVLHYCLKTWNLHFGCGSFI